MIVTSSQRPRSIQIIKRQDYVEVVLRRDYTTKVVWDSLADKEETFYQYDEVKVKTRIQPATLIAEKVRDNFDDWFEQGKRIENLNSQIEEKQKEMNELLNEFKQIKVNEELEINDDTLFEGLAETFEQSMFTDQTAEVALEGISDLYDMLSMVMMDIEELKGGE